MNDNDSQKSEIDSTRTKAGKAGVSSGRGKAEAGKPTQNLLTRFPMLLAALTEEFRFRVQSSVGPTKNYITPPIQWQWQVCNAIIMAMVYGHMLKNPVN